MEELNQLESDIMKMNSKANLFDDSLKKKLDESVDRMKAEVFEGILKETDFCEENLLLKHLGNSLKYLNKSYKE